MDIQKNAAGEWDVRVLVPIQRHELLIKLFGELPVHEDFIFINDHDPLPLYYEFKSIFGDVVDWEYLKKGGTDWKVKVSRTGESVGREFEGISTLMDLRKVEQVKWKHVVFHRYGMMSPNTVMELIATEEPTEIKQIFEKKFSDKHKWEYKKREDGEFVIHITKLESGGKLHDDFTVVNIFDIRPYPPARRHEMFYNAFEFIQPGEAFEFINDHDPKPLYYQMEAESKDAFEWEYLQEGPEEWKVRVIKPKQ